MGATGMTDTKRTEGRCAYVQRVLTYFHSKGSTFEICALGVKQAKSPAWEGYAGGKDPIVAGWFNDVKRAAEAALKLDAIGSEGVYHTINDTIPALLGRAGNRLKAGVSRSSDRDVPMVQHLLVDIDPERPKGVSSTNPEHDFALAHSATIRQQLMEMGWPEPLHADSGNGAHLIFKVPDLPNAPENVDLLKAVLSALDQRFRIQRDGIVLNVDTKVFNPARLSKLYGTRTRKGDASEERPHRWAQIIAVPGDPNPVALHLLKEMAASAKTEGQRSTSPRMDTNRSNGAFREPFRLLEYLDHYGAHVKTTKDHNGSTLYVLDTCLFDPSHSGGEAAIGQTSEGRLFYQCFHDSCKGRTWADARQVISASDSLTQFSSPEKPTKKRKTQNSDGAAGPSGDEDEKAPTATEDAIARAFAEMRKDELRFDHHRGAWFHLEDGIWRLDETKLAFDLIRDLCHEMNPADPKTERAGTARGVETFARSDRAFAVTSELWDRDPWLLGTPGGTIDLQTGKLHPPRTSDYITQTTSVAPARTADAPRWLKFLDETTRGDRDLVRFLGQMAGYCLTGITREHSLFFVYGRGGNGKGVFLNALTNIVGGYATTAAMDTFTASKTDRHPTDLAMLQHARLVTASETEEGRAWAESRIKQLTGGDPITARYMRRDFFTYLPKFKLLIVGNHRPVLHNVDDANRRRFNIIPFVNKPPVPDRHLEDHLRTEYPAILRWMIDGCLDWQANGLCRPACVVDATAEYFEEQDLFGQWLQECCTLGRLEWEPVDLLYKSWKSFSEARGDVPGSVKTFTGNLLRQELKADRMRVHGSQQRIYRGISLKSQRENRAPYKD